MSYTVKDHGIWRPYTPDPKPAWVLAAQRFGGVIVFLEREGDGADFYDFRDGDPFAEGAVVATTLLQPATGAEIVGSVFRDPSMIFPTGQRLIEIGGVDPAETKPHNLFAWLTYHPDTLTFSGTAEPPKPPAPPGISVQRYQFAGQAAAEGIIDDDDAMAWAASGRTPNALVRAVKTAVPDPDRQKRVLLFLAGTTVVPRDHDLTPVLGASFGKDTPAKLDAFFAAAADR